MKIDNWNFTESCHPTRVVEPGDLPHLIRIVENRDDQASPSPVRAVGSVHSLNPCFTTTGTLVKMKADAFRRIGQPAHGTVTVGAGVTMLELRDALRAHGLQIAVTPEIGNATAGSVACCGTKDASLQNGPGQVSSTVVGARIVDASGTERALRDDELHAFRSSYGLLGIVHEVTFETCLLQHVKYAPVSLPLGGLTFEEALGDADGFLGFLFPYNNRFVAERRTLQREASASLSQLNPLGHAARQVRTQVWLTGGHPFSEIPALFDIQFNLAFPLLRFGGPRVDTMIDFREGDGADQFFDFAFWAFPISTWDTAIPAYVEFCHKFLGLTGFRPSLPTEVYHVKHDDKALLSFSPREDAFTLDMVHMVTPGHRDDKYPLWQQMNDEFNNQIALPFGARPLLNQTKRLTKHVVQTSLGQDWTRFAALRAAADPGPNPRFLSDFFAQLGA